MKIQKIAYSLVTLALIILFLITAQSILIPFIFALLIWFIVKKTRNFLDKNQFIRKRIPKSMKTFLASLFIFTIIFLVGKIIGSNIDNLSKTFSTFSANAGNIANKVNELFSININEELSNLVSFSNFTNFYLKSIFDSVTLGLGNFIMILFYVTFLFFEESLFHDKIALIFTEEKKIHNVKTIIGKIDKSLSDYMSLKSLVNIISAILSFIVLYLSGIDSPFFWAFLIFIFNFIPAIGPIVATLLPAVFALLQFGYFSPFLIILLGVGAIVMLMGSYVEPRIMGNSLNISPLVTILSLAVWGTLWGVTGMLLCVPITVAMIIIFAQFKETKAIAVLLSEKGIV